MVDRARRGVRIARRSISAFLVVALPCCGAADTRPGTASNQAVEPIGLSPRSFGEQVVVGERLFADNCALCHGESGQGKADAPRLVDLERGALPLEPPAERRLRRLRFQTVGDVADFVIRTMPLNAPGRLSDEQYFSVIAFDIHVNGIDLGEGKLDASLAYSLEIPRK